MKSEFLIFSCWPVTARPAFGFICLRIGGGGGGGGGGGAVFGGGGGGGGGEGWALYFGGGGGAGRDAVLAGCLLPSYVT